MEKILELKKEHPEAKIVVHPECKAVVAAVADYVGSTAGILDYCGKVEATEFIVVTEAGILAEMRRKYPEKSFIPAPPIDSTCGCNECRYMKMVSLESILACLENDELELIGKVSRGKYIIQWPVSCYQRLDTSHKILM